MNKKNMNYIDEFNNFDTSKKILESIYNKTGKEIRIMEVCGTHTTTIVKNGIKNLLPKNIKLISGPGCPICVTPTSYIDAIIELTKIKDIIISTFGDVMSVPGSKSSLKICKALGKDIRVIYSPLQAIEIAKKNSEKEVIFLGIGFETTAPIIAIAIDKAKKESIKNFSVFQSIKTMPSIIRTILSDKNSTPLQCKLFRKTCNLQNPVGVCMASREGTCAIYYKYG